MQQIIAIADQIVAREGGFVNDADDPGGATKFGVTLATLRRLGRDLTDDGKVNLADVKAVTREGARDIFIRDYFYRPQIDKLPETLQASIFDMQVNAGANSIRLLQRLLRKMGQAVSVDGVVGPQTALAARLASDAAPDHIANAYGIERRNYYYQIADKRVASRKFAMRRDGGKGGWIKRAEEFIAPRYHLSDQEHQRRVSAWA